MRIFHFSIRNYFCFCILVPSYKLVVPRYSTGGIVKRQAEANDIGYPDRVSYTLDGFDDESPFHLNLHRSVEIVSPDFLMVSRGVNDNDTAIQHVQPDHCHYFGNVTSHPGSMAAMSSCDGLVSRL